MDWRYTRKVCPPVCERAALMASHRDITRALLPLRWPWQRPPEPPSIDEFSGKMILLASEGRPIPRGAVALTGRMAKKAGAEVHVMSVARIWGTSFGLPNPGLMPNK